MKPALLFILWVIPALAVAQQPGQPLVYFDTVELRTNPAAAYAHAEALAKTQYRELSLALHRYYYHEFTHSPDTNTLKLCFSLVDCYWGVRSYDSATLYIDTLQARVAGMPKTSAFWARYYKYRADSYRQQLQEDSAWHYINQARQWYRQNNNGQQPANLLYQVSQMHGDFYDNFDSAMFYLLASQTMARQNNDTALIIDNLMAMANAQIAIGNYKYSTSYYHLALQLCQQAGYTTHLPYIYYRFTQYYYSSVSTAPDSLYYYSNLLYQISLPSQLYFYQRYAALYTSFAHEDAQRYDSALYYIKLAENAHQADTRHMAKDDAIYKNFSYNIYGSYAAVYEKMGQYKLAQQYLNRAAANVNPERLNTLMFIANTNAKLAEARGNLQETVKYLKQAYAYSLKEKNQTDSIRDAMAGKKVSELEKQYQTAEKQRQILALENDNQQQAAQNRLLLFVVTVSLLFLAAGAYTYRKIRFKNKQLNLAGRKLKDSNNTKDKLISIVSHDLRRPMDNLGMLLQLMENQDARVLLDENPTILNDVTEEFKTVNTMLRDLLFWVLLQRDAMMYKPQQFSLSSLVNEQLSFIKPVVRNKALQVKTEVGDFTLMTDRDMLRFILRNLLSNAVQHTPEKGAITVKTVLTEGAFRIVVQDTGIGMDEATLQGLFQVKFNQAALDVSKTGAGVGLSLCADIAKKMGARLYAESQQGSGSLFVVEFTSEVVATNLAKARIGDAQQQKVRH